MVWWWHPQSKPMRASRSTSKVSDELWTTSVLQWCVFKLTQEIKRSRVPCRYLMMLRSFSGGISLVLLYPFSILLFIWIFNYRTGFHGNQTYFSLMSHDFSAKVNAFPNSFCALKSKVVPGALLSPRCERLEQEQATPPTEPQFLQKSVPLHLLFDWFWLISSTCAYMSVP